MARQATDSSLSRHVPPIALRWVQDSPEKTWHTIDGSLCFADISGFTALTERLTAHGRLGAEELVETLSGVFGTMLDVAAERGGQLLKFGGDALLLLFDGDAHARRAAGAAVEMRRALRSATGTSAVGRLKLSMSVGIGSGEILFLLVGAPHRELVIVGPVVEQTLTAEQVASAGQILVTGATAARLPRAAVRLHDADHLSLGWRRAPLDTAYEPLDATGSAADLAALLPAELRDALADRPEPAHRIATMAFVGLTGLGLTLRKGPAAAAAVVDEAMQTIQRALHDEQVTLLAVDPAIDGFKLMCSAGAPVNSEDDEGRMLRALRRITTSPLPLPVSAGVNRGPVFAAEVGNSWRAAYSAMGDVTNTAARIMSKAPGGSLYVHPSVLEHARTRYESQPVGPFALKGKSEPITFYEVGPEIGLRPSAGPETLPLIGRGPELAQLREAVEAVADGRGGVATVYGPIGVGKSRVVREALRHRPDVPAVTLRGEPYATASPYRPFRDPLREVLGIERAAESVMAAALIGTVGRIDPSLVPLAPLLGTVTHLDVPTTAEASTIGSQHRADRIADLVIRALQYAHPGPLVIVAEDAHWLDVSSVHLLGRLERVTDDHPWLLVVVRRESLDGFLPATGAEVAVAPLDDASMRALLIAATEAAPLRPHETDTIVRRAAGSPLYLEQWALAARSASSVDIVPDTLQAAIATQLDAIPPVARRALACAAVLGRSFRRDLLVDLLGTEGLQLDDATERTLEPFLEVDTVDRLRFRNGLVRDVAYETMAYRTRARLHRAAGEMLEALTGGVGSDVPVLAYHFWRAGDHARAWRYSLRSAARARAVAAHADAATLIERALEAARSLAEVEDDERMAQWLQLGDVRDQAGMLDLALDAYRAAARFIPADDGIARAELFLRRAATHERAGLYAVALREATRARHVLDDARGHRAAVARANALAFSALMRQRQEHAADALHLAKLAAVEADRALAVAARARATNVISWASTMLGEPGAERWAYQAMALYEEAGDLVGQADMANNLGVQAYYAGRWEETLALYERSRAACERVGDIIDAAGTDANIGEVLVNQGRLDEAEAVLGDASRVLRASGHRWGEAFAAMHQGRILMARGELAAAEETLTKVLDQFLALGRAASAYETSLHLADCMQRAGRPEQALEILAGAARLTTDDVSIFDPAHDRIEAAALAAANRWEESTLALESGIRAARERGLEYELSLMLAAAADSPVPVDTGSDEPAAAESARLLAQLGVVAGPRQRHIGSPAPS